MKIIYFQEHCITPHPLNYRVNIFNTDLDGHRLFLLVEGKKLEEMLGAPLLQGEHVNWKANSEAYTWCGGSSTQTCNAGTWKSRQQARNARRGRCWEAQQRTHLTTQQLLTSFQDQGANNRIRLMPYKLAEHLQEQTDISLHGTDHTHHTAFPEPLQRFLQSQSFPARHGGWGKSSAPPNGAGRIIQGLFC